MLKKYMKLNREDTWLALATPAVLWLAVLLGTQVVMGFLKNKSTLVLLYPVFALPCLALILFFISAAYFQAMFDLNLSFGCTRRQSLGLMAGHMAIMCGAAVLSSLVCVLLDRVLNPALTGLMFGAPETVETMLGASVSIGVDFMAISAAFLVLLPAAVILGMIAGTLVRRFGGRAGGILYLIFLFLLLSWNHNEAWLRANLLWLGPVLGVALVAAFIWSVRSLLTDSIRL